jgi:hypothetical protein
MFTHSKEGMIKMKKIKCPPPSHVWKWYYKIIIYHFPLNINELDF